MSKHYPPFILKLENTDRELFSLITELYDLVMGPGALDVKTKLLITLAVDAFAGSTGVKPIADAAQRAGASETEVSEALRIACLVAGNKVLFATQGVFEAK